MSKANGRPPLADPGSKPRIAKSGDAQRERPIFALKGGFDRGAWKVDVTPLRGSGSLGAGRALDGGRQKPRAVFEVRAEYTGLGLPEFGSQPGTKRIETFQTEEEALATAMARRAADRLRAGERDILMNQIAEELKGRR